MVWFVLQPKLNRIICEVGDTRSKQTTAYGSIFWVLPTSYLNLQITLS